MVRAKQVGWGSVAVLAVLAGIFGIHYATGAKTGESCSRTTSCRRLFGAACVLRDAGNFCSKTCDDASDCWEGWTCEVTTVQHKRRNREIKACVPGATP